MLLSPNVTGRPNSDVLRPRFTAQDLLNRTGGDWIIDFGVDAALASVVGYEMPFDQVRRAVKPERDKNRRERMKKTWWLHGEARPGLRNSLAGLARFVLTPEISKHRIFAWTDATVLADHKTRAFGSDEDWFFGVLHSRIHELWARAMGTQLGESESGFTYTPSTCFETFPCPLAGRGAPTTPATPAGHTQAEVDAAHRYFMAKEDAAPYGDEATHRAAIAAAAKECNALRERWLNPSEWTHTEYLEFPASVVGPWDRFIDRGTVLGGVGSARYPRLVAHDEAAARELKARTLTVLYNERPAWLDFAQRTLDAAVATAYGWPVDMPDAQMLERLLALNLARGRIEAEAAKAATATATGNRKPQRAKRADEMV